MSLSTAQLLQYLSTLGFHTTSLSKQTVVLKMSPTGGGSPVATQSEPDSDPETLRCKQRVKPQKANSIPTGQQRGARQNMKQSEGSMPHGPSSSYSFRRLVQTNNGQSRKAVSCGSQGHWHGTMSVLGDQDHDQDSGSRRRKTASVT